MSKKKAGAAPALIDYTVPVVSCEACPALCKSRTKIVNGRGPEGASIMIVGEGPGQEEDSAGVPFRGKTGELLAYMCEEAGIGLDDVFLTNAIRCRPAGNRTPTAREIDACRGYLNAEIAKVKPKVIVAAGASALAALIKAMPVGEVLGQTLFHHSGIPVIPTYHPAYYMRKKWGQLPLGIGHLRQVRDIAAGRNALQPLEEARANAVAITTCDGLRELRDYLLSDSVSVITLDTESYGVGEEWTGLDWMGAELLCLSFSALDEWGRAIRAGFAVPLLQQGGKDWWGDDYDEAVSLLHDILGSDKPKCIQNSIHDLRLLERDSDDPPFCIDARVRTAIGFPVNAIKFDTMLIQRLLDENLPANENALMTMYTDMPYYEALVIEESQHKHHMEAASNETLWTYAALDADALARILEAQLKKLAKKPNLRWILDNITMPMVRASWNMTRMGIAMDVEFFGRLCAAYEKKVREARAAVFTAYGHGEFNLNAPKQVQHVLFAKLGLPQSGRKTKASKGCADCIQATKDDNALGCLVHDSTDKDSLKGIIRIFEKSGKAPHPILNAILKYKEVSKQKGTYVDGADGGGGVLAHIRDDLRIHPEFKVNAAATGRQSAVKPPVQQIPKGVHDDDLGENILRRPYVVTPGRRAFEVDWSQGELWVMAYRSKDPTLMRLLVEGRDVHTYVARKLCELGISNQFPKSDLHPEMSDDEWKENFDELRRKAKVFVFGLDYGMTYMGVAERLHCDELEAQLLVRAYMTTVFPGLQSYFDDIEAEMIERGIIYDEFGREGHFYDSAVVKKFSKWDWNEMFRTGSNMPIQAGLNDLHSYVHPRFEAEFWNRLWITLIVHDSCYGEFPGDLTEEETVALMWEIKNFFENQAKTLVLWDGRVLDWSIPVEVSWGTGWGNLTNKLTANGNLKLDHQDDEEDYAGDD